MGRLGSLLLKGLGVFVLAVIALSVLTTVVGIVLWTVSAVVSLLVSLVVLGIVGLVVFGLISMLWGDDDTDDITPGTSTRDVESPDAESRIRSAYVEGELTEDEFERELDRVLGSDDGSDSGRQFDSTRSRSRETDRSRR